MSSLSAMFHTNVTVEPQDQPTTAVPGVVGANVKADAASAGGKEPAGIGQRVAALWPHRPKRMHAPAAIVFADDVAAAEGVKIMGDVWKNEETRFNNLNSRAIAVLSATALVTAVLGFFSKNLLDTSLASARTGALWGAGITLVLLGGAAAFVVLGVLRPSQRPIFGHNELTLNKPANTIFKAQDIHAIAYREYGGLYTQLANRSSWKAYWLTFAYYCLFAAVVVSILTTIYVIWKV